MTFSAMPVVTAAAASPMCPLEPPPLPVACMAEKRRSRRPSAAAILGGSFLSPPNDTSPSMSRTSTPASSAALMIERRHSSNSLASARPRLKKVLSPTPITAEVPRRVRFMACPSLEDSRVQRCGRLRVDKTQDDPLPGLTMVDHVPHEIP